MKYSIWVEAISCLVREIIEVVKAITKAIEMLEGDRRLVVVSTML